MIKATPAPLLKVLPLAQLRAKADLHTHDTYSPLERLVDEIISPGSTSEDTANNLIRLVELLTEGDENKRGLIAEMVFNYAIVRSELGVDPKERKKFISDLFKPEGEVTEHTKNQTEGSD